jgi:hypothetical protein
MISYTTPTATNYGTSNEHVRNNNQPKSIDTDTTSGDIGIENHRLVVVKRKMIRFFVSNNF